jgi:hypothetical protein
LNRKTAVQPYFLDVYKYTGTVAKVQLSVCIKAVL